MNLKNLFNFNQINILSQCKRYSLSLWQCPSFLFLVMGLVIIISSLITYTVGNRYIKNPEITALVVLLTSAILFIIAFTIVQSFERLLEVIKMKSEFINIISHQLRTPLSSLKWTIELLTSGRLEMVKNKQAEYFKILKENSERMEKMISLLLTVSKVETPNFILKRKEVYFPDLLKEAIKKYEPFAKELNVEIRSRFRENLPKILADADQIKIVIENLLDNAILYTKNNGLVEILLDKQGKNLYFEIKDNGVGIPKENQKYIFQKFFRSENPLRYQTPGFGLGLYVSKSIIKKSGGDIGFSSQEGKGSTFWFTLPIK